jgi:hypothetical protein
MTGKQIEGTNGGIDFAAKWREVINYKDLLTKYVHHVCKCADTSYLTSRQGDRAFTDKEWNYLRELADEDEVREVIAEQVMR